MAEVIMRVRPVPLSLDAYLPNPHRGCCTFQHFNGDQLFPGTTWSEEGPVEFPPPLARVIDGYLPTTVSYCRWFWALMEPRRGEFDFNVIDKALTTCAERGQSLAVRLMAFGSRNRQPQVPAWYSDSYPMEMKPMKGVPWPVPVHDAPEYLEHWGNFVREFARRYDGHPLLETIDITYIGPWGEGAGECSEEQCGRFAQLWKEAFVHTPRLALIGGKQMKIGLATGSGWRCDCFGDVQQKSDPLVRKDSAWNHMYDTYPYAIAQEGARDAWQRAPVHLETCWVPMHWANENFDIDFILEQGLKYHATYWMPKYTRLPEKWMEKLARFSNQLGYRYIFRHCVFDRQVTPGGTLNFQAWIENVGVAPIYKRYDVALRFRQGDASEIVVLDQHDIRKWIPGDACIKEQVKVPVSLKPGWAELAIALIDPKTREAKISFANKEVYGDRWLDLRGVEVQPAS